MFGWVLNTSLLNMSLDKSSFLNVFYKKVVLKKFHKIHTKTPVPQACNFIKKEALAQVFSSEFCEIFKNTFLYRTPLVAASSLNIPYLHSHDQCIRIFHLYKH